MEIGIPLTPRSPRPKILEPDRCSPCIRIDRNEDGVSASVTIRYNSNSGLFCMRPVLEDLSDLSLVIDADILGDEMSDILAHF